jgi:N-methylhydantoinase A
VLAIARELHIPKVIVPRFPSHFSALGMLMADERHDFIRTHYADLSVVDFVQLVAIHDEMASAAAAGLRHAAGAERQAHLDIRYVGQEFTLSVPVTRAQLVAGHRAAIRKAFDALYEQRYAHHSPDEPVEMVNMRLALVGKRTQLAFPVLVERGAAKPQRTREVYFDDPARPVACPVYERNDLGAGCRIAGPALIQEHGTTTVLFRGDDLQVAPSGEMIIAVGGA